MNTPKNASFHNTPVQDPDRPISHMNNKPKLLVLTSTFPRWENDTDPPFVYELSRRLTKDFSVFILTPHYPGSLTFEHLEGMEVYRFRYFFERFERLAGQTGILPTIRKQKLYYLLIPFFLFAQLISVLRLHYRVKPEIIHAHWLLPQGFIAALTKYLTGTPFIVTAHGADVFGLNKFPATQIKSFTLRRATHSTVVSKAIFQALSNLSSSKKLSIIPMGVDSRRFQPSPSKHPHNHPRLLFVGRLSEKKGVSYLLQAMPLILEKFSGTTLQIIGGGELREHLEKEAEELKIANRVEFCGAVTNDKLPDFYKKADIFIGPSVHAVGGDTEGFGLTFVEAALSGCLVIGTDVGGIGDIIKDGETGLLVPEKNSLAIAEKVIHALRNWDEMRTISKNARKYCWKNFDWEIIGGKYTTLLKKCLPLREKRTTYR